MIGNSTNTQRLILENITWQTTDYNTLTGEIYFKKTINFQVQ